MSLENYRDNKIVINGREMVIGGFERPEDDVEHFEELKDSHGVGAVISLSGNYSKAYKKAGLDPDFYTYGDSVEVYDWFDTPYEETTPIPPSVYDSVYESVVKAQQSGKKVAIHCGAGDGRTGTALATLKLRELLEVEYMSRGDKIGLEQKKTLSVHVHHGSTGTGGEADVPVTPLVKKAIDEIRKNDNDEHHSVESPNDVRTLMQYEQHLRKQLVLRYQHEQSDYQHAVKMREKFDPEGEIEFRPSDYFVFRKEAFYNPDALVKHHSKANYQHKLHLAVDIQNREDYEKAMELLLETIKKFDCVSTVKTAGHTAYSTRNFAPGKELTLYFAPETWEGYQNPQDRLMQHMAVIAHLDKALVEKGLKRSESLARVEGIGDHPLQFEKVVNFRQTENMIYVSPKEYEPPNGKYIRAEQRDKDFDNPYDERAMNQYKQLQCILNKADLINTVEQNPGLLRFAAHEVHNDKEIVLHAIKNDPQALDYASVNLKKNNTLRKIANIADPEKRAQAVEHKLQIYKKRQDSSFKSYEKLWATHSCGSSDEARALASVKGVLNDYASNFRLLKGHWNRHHTKEVKKLLKEDNVDKIIEGLDNLAKESKTYNSNGSLARRTAFLKAKLQESKATSGGKEQHKQDGAKLAQP